MGNLEQAKELMTKIEETYLVEIVCKRSAKAYSLIEDAFLTKEIDTSTYNDYSYKISKIVMSKIIRLNDKFNWK